MFKNLISLILEGIEKNGSWSVFWGGVIEQVAGVLIPSPLIPMSAGFLLIPKELNLVSAAISVAKKISLPYALGGSLGASLLFFIAFYGGRTLIDKFGKFFGISLKQIDKFKARFTRGFKDEILLTALLIIPVTSVSLISVSCALIGISPWEFFPLLLLGTFFRSLVLGTLGWKVGETYELLIYHLEKTETLVSILTLGAIFSILGFLYLKKGRYFHL